MEDLKQQYLEEMKSMINQIQIEDYHNERINIHYRRKCEIKIDELKVNFNGMSIEINKKKELRQQEQEANLNTYTTKPSRRFNFIYDDDDDYEERLSHHGGEDSSTIPKKESDEFIKFSVEDFVPILSESEDTSDSECDLPFCGNSITLSNPLFDLNDDFTSTDDESLSDEDVPKDKVKIYSNPLFEFDDECIYSDVNPLFDKDCPDFEDSRARGFVHCLLELRSLAYGNPIS
nr:hypothetical protein [Tanacetum cinerariifolium]